MMAGRRAAVDWEAMFSALVDGTLSGDITLPSDITYLKQYCFVGCANLTSVNAPNVVGLGNSVFEGMYGLVTVNLGVLQSIGTSAFSNCRNLETPIIIGNSVTSLGNSVFFNCYLIPYIDVGTGVTSIGNQCFRYLNACQYVIMRPITPPTLGISNFVGSGSGTYPIYVPDESVEAYKAANNWSALADRIKPLSELGG